MSLGSEGFVLSVCFLLHSQLQELTDLKVNHRKSEFLQKKNTDTYGVWGGGVFSNLLGLPTISVSANN